MSESITTSRLERFHNTASTYAQFYLFGQTSSTLHPSVWKLLTEPRDAVGTTIEHTDPLFSKCATTLATLVSTNESTPIPVYVSEQQTTEVEKGNLDPFFSKYILPANRTSTTGITNPASTVTTTMEKDRKKSFLPKNQKM